ncbi:hypothetical protein OF83DRAFT_1066483, partial [Amylostereum chailletii]
TAAHLVTAMYDHDFSEPDLHHAEVAHYFSDTLPATQIGYCAPSLSTWAYDLILDEVDLEVCEACNAKYAPHLRVRASGGTRQPGAVSSTEDRNAAPEAGTNPGTNEDTAPHVCTSVISEVLYTRNSWVNLFPLVRSFGLFVSMAPHSLYRLGSQLAQNTPFTTTSEALSTAADEKWVVMKARFKNFVTDPILVVFDNIQSLARSRISRLGARNRMVTGTGATAVEMEDCPPGAFNLHAIRERYEAGTRRNITVDDIRNSMDNEHLMVVFLYHWLDALVQFVPALTPYRAQVTRMFDDNTRKHQINPHRHTKVHPLSTNGANETTTPGLREAIHDFLSQLGLGEDGTVDHLMFFHGDGKSFEGIHKVKKLSSGKTSNFFSWRFIQPVLELWHTKWTALSRILRCLWGAEDGHHLRDPSTLGYMANAIKSPKVSDLHKVDFYPNAHLLNVVVRGHILRCWKVLLGTDDIEAHFEQLADADKLPSIIVLHQQASLLLRRYSSTKAYWKARSKHTDKNFDPIDAPVGAPWPTPAESSEGIENTPVIGDHCLANVNMLLRDGLEFLEVCRGTALGDIGRTLEVHKRWIFSFAGSGNSNYAAYMAEMFLSLYHDYTDATREGLLNNYLVNLVGRPGNFHELDLMQEHYNGWLEAFVQHKGHEFDSPFIRNVISMHVHHLIDILREWEQNVDLAARTLSHGAPPDDNEIRLVKDLGRQFDLHRRHEGRSYGFLAEDNYTEGYKKMGQGRKLAEYIGKTIEEWANMHEQLPMPEGFEDMSTYMHTPISLDEQGRMLF